MIRKSLFRQIARFCNRKDDIQEKQSSYLTEAESRLDQIPIHLRAYDKAKYEVPAQKIKRNSGYALIQIEPFPRARIMKICYNLLADLKKGIAEEDFFRIYNEQKLKYLMEVVDKEEDTQQLEKFFGIPSIQILIMNLSKQFQVFQAYRDYKTWDHPDDEEDEREFINEMAGYREPEKYPAYKRPQRNPSKML